MSDTGLPYNPANILFNDEDLVKILTRFGIQEPHKDINVYRRAFVNRSYCTRKNENYVNGNTKCPADCLPLQEESNERLEYFGDSILNHVIAKYLFDRYPQQNEGFLTIMRTKLVNGNKLAELSKEIGLEKFMIISNQIEENNGRENRNILEDTLEAFIGAIYIDFDEGDDVKGSIISRRWIVGLIEETVDFVDLIKGNINYKDKLVKYCQHACQYVPQFEEVSSGDRKKPNEMCKMMVKSNTGRVIAVGTDRTRKGAEIAASKKALEYFGQPI